MDRKNYRTRFEIINIFLNELKKRKKVGLSKTMTIQKSGLSPNGFKEYFDRLVLAKLIECKKRILITQLGEDYVKKSNLLLIKIDKLNKEYKINPQDISYIN